MGNLPIKKFRSGNIEAAVWKNTRKANGGEVEFKTVSLSRSWKKNDDDVWRHDVVNLRRNDLQKAILVLQKAQEDLLLAEKEEGEHNE